MRTRADTLTVYDENGNLQTTSGSFPNLSAPLGITFDPHNHFLYVANVGKGGIFPNLLGPRGIAFDSNNRQLYVTSVIGVNSGTVRVLYEHGDPILTSGAFANLCSPIGIAFDANNRNLYVADFDRNTVLV